MTIERIGILGLGEVGRILAEDLIGNAGAHVRVWDYQFDNPDSAAAHNLGELLPNPLCTSADSAATAAAGCQLVLSAVTADQALPAAQSVLPELLENTWFVDLNSVSPATKLSISDVVSAAGGLFVEASVMSPILPLRTASPILLSGSHSAELESLAGKLGFSDIRAISEKLGEASATKMCRSVIVKGMEALVTESLLTARHYGVENAVLESLNNLFPRPDWQEHARYLISRSLLHGERRAAEMVEASRTVQEAGVSPWMSQGSAERQAWAPQFDSALDEESLDDMLDAIRSQLLTQ